MTGSLMPQKIAIIPGDGIGPEIMQATLAILEKLRPGFEYVEVQAGLTALDQSGELLPQATLDAIEACDATLKGPLTTPVGQGFRSINVTLRKHFDLYANVRPALSYPGTRANYQDVDIITIRENTEGAYGAEGQTLSEDGQRAESMTVVTRKGSERVVRYAFELARREGRKKVSAVHKANILKTTSGLFLSVAREVAAEYPDIEFNDYIVDNTCMQLVMDPHQFDVMVTTNLFGDIVSDLCAGLVGGLGMAPGANIGDKAAIFEAVHGSAPDIAGKSMANPCALLLAASMMLGHLGYEADAEKLRLAIRQTLLAKDRLTPDLGGDGSTDSIAQAIADRI